jgi:hypothetical protein
MGFKFLLDSGLHVADAVTEAPAARDVDDAAPLVTAEGRFAITWAGNFSGCRASLSSDSASERLCHCDWSGYVMPLALVSGIKEAEPHLAKQLLYSGIARDSDLQVGFT